MALTQSFPMHCPRCETVVAARLVNTYSIREEEESPDETLEFLFLKCPECGRPFLAERTNYWVGGPHEWHYEQPTVIYPAERALDASVPKAIADSYDEAQRCFRAAAFTASAVMCRRTAEAICVHHGKNKGVLAQRLKEMLADEIIERRMFEWAEALREVGNEAAHRVDIVVTKEDARDLLDFTRALIEYIFTFTESFKKFRERRAASP